MPNDPEVISDPEPDPEPEPSISFVTRDELRTTVADAMRKMRKAVKKSASPAPVPVPEAPSPTPAPALEAPRGALGLFQGRVPKKGA